MFQDGNARKNVGIVLIRLVIRHGFPKFSKIVFKDESDLYLTFRTRSDACLSCSHILRSVTFFGCRCPTKGETETQKLPRCLTRLRLNDTYNKPLLNLPPNLDSLHTGWAFHKPVVTSTFPRHLTRLTLGANFNHPLGQNILPLSLTFLKIGYSFNQPILENSLPPSLTHLYIGDTFDQPFEKFHLPKKTLTHLTLGCCFNQKIRKTDLPSTITHLSVGFRFKKRFEKNKLPPLLWEPVWFQMDNMSLDDLPDSITHLTCNPRPSSLPVNNLPFGLTHLVLCGYFDHPVINLPATLKHLVLGSAFRHPVDKLPNGLTNLVMASSHYEHSLRYLPPSLTHITLSGGFAEVVGTLPPTVSHLFLIDKPIDLKTDLDIIMDYTKRSRKEALEKLYFCGGDVINTIICLGFS